MEWKSIILKYPCSVKAAPFLLIKFTTKTKSSLPHTFLKIFFLIFFLLKIKNFLRMQWRKNSTVFFFFLIEFYKLFVVVVVACTILKITHGIAFFSYLFYYFFILFFLFHFIFYQIKTNTKHVFYLNF